MGGFRSLQLGGNDQQQQQQQQQVLSHLAAAGGLMGAPGAGPGSSAIPNGSTLVPAELQPQAPSDTRVSQALKLLLTSLTLEELEEVHTQLDGWLSLLRNTNNTAAAAAGGMRGL
jgi:hypothetical protein